MGIKNSKIKHITFDKNLKNLLRKKEITLTQLAYKTGLNKTTIHNYCNGVKPRCLLSLIRISDYFNISIDDLIYGSDRKYNSEKSKNIITLEILIKHDNQNQEKVE